MEKENLYQTVTKRIVEELNKGVVPWHTPWVVNFDAYSRATGKPYSLLNQLILYRPGEYLTLKAATKLGGKLKDGAASSTVVFWRVIPITETNKRGEDVESFIPVIAHHDLYHVNDFEGIAPKYPVKEYKTPNIAQRDEKVEELIAGYAKREGLKICREEFSNASFYEHGLFRDRIVLPRIDQFESTEKYYSTLFHEMVHSTGAKQRLSRKINGKKDSKAYAVEELVAEIGACFLMQYCGLPLDKTIGDSAAYIDGWRDKIRKDPKLIATAAGRAQKAIEYILGRELGEKHSPIKGKGKRG